MTRDWRAMLIGKLDSFGPKCVRSSGSACVCATDTIDITCSSLSVCLLDVTVNQAVTAKLWPRRNCEAIAMQTRSAEYTLRNDDQPAVEQHSSALTLSNELAEKLG